MQVSSPVHVALHSFWCCHFFIAKQQSLVTSHSRLCLPTLMLSAREHRYNFLWFTTLTYELERLLSVTKAWTTFPPRWPLAGKASTLALGLTVAELPATTKALYSGQTWASTRRSANNAKPLNHRTFTSFTGTFSFFGGELNPITVTLVTRNFPKSSYMNQDCRKVCFQAMIWIGTSLCRLYKRLTDNFVNMFSVERCTKARTRRRFSF